jgi:hypothetical protein
VDLLTVIFRRNCKARKVKCGEEKPRCSNCERLDEDCDYKIRLSWGGRPLKKKLQENNGHDPNGDDQSQFIPGAGQFSLNPHFPAPQTFVQTNPTNGTARKPPVPRAGSGKKTSMSNYQTVFAVGEMQAPPPAPVQQTPIVTPPPSHGSHSNGHSRNSSTASSLSIPPSRVDPQLNVQVPLTQAQQTPPERHHAHRNSREERNPYAWNHSLTPINTNPLQSPFDESHVRHDHDRAFFSPYTPGPGPFSPAHTTSPITSFHSPPGHHHSSSPDIPHAQPHYGSPHEKSYHPPPMMLQSPTKKHKTSTSPIVSPPPPSPFVYDRNPMTQAPELATHNIAQALSYMNHTIPAMPMGMHDAFMPMPPVTTVALGNTSGMRRLSVENLLAEPLPLDAFNSYHHQPDPYDKYETKFMADDHIPYDEMDDEEIEEITRHEYNDVDFSMLQVNRARKMFQMNPAYVDLPQMSIPRRLDPLPQMLLQNEQNKMYFHHYLKYTARLLVPHDCSENPFKHILPQSTYPPPSCERRLRLPVTPTNPSQWPSKPII